MNNTIPIQSQIFVRLSSDEIQHVEVSRFSDDSAFVAGTEIERIYEGHHDVFQQALRDLAQLGFIEIAAAKEEKLIPNDWTPNSSISCDA